MKKASIRITNATAICAALSLAATSARAGLLYEPSSYAAQDNLVVNLDGIRNAGLLKAHDSSAAEWKNIGRVANDAAFTALNGDTSAWVADGYHFAGGAYGKLKFKQNLGNAMTVQIVADAKGSENSTTWPSFFGCAEDWANIYFSAKDTGIVHFKADAVTGLNYDSRANVTCGANVKYLNAALDSSAHKQIITTADSFATGWKEGSGGTQSAPGSLNWYFGSCGGSQSALDARYLVGTIKAIRVYNKVLSDTELAANRVIDEARFFAGIPVTNVVVATAVAGLEGNEGSGAYAYDASGYTFTAPQKATLDGVVYACAGYTLETWNGTAWSSPISYESCSYTATDTTAKVRLTWQWRRAHAEVPVALDPLFDDYVTDGLVLHLDGIRNVGADKPHSWTSSQWIDLVKGNVASFQHDEADASTWLDDGYYFGGRSFAQFVNALSGLTNMVTVQVVCDTTTNALHQLKNSASPTVFWPNLVGTGDNDQLNIYYDANGATRGRLTFKNANGGNVNLANDADKDVWEGRYATAIRDNTTKKNYIIQGTSLTGAAAANAASGNIVANTLRVGCAGGSLSTRQQRWFIGTIKAVRIYDRVLTDAELEQNRAIDEARFFGGPLPTENVVVASSVRGVDGNEPEGAYALPAGGHTFSAPASVTVGEDSYSCTGYTLETWDGSAWGTPASSASLSCALTDTSAKVRLTWQWAHTAGPGYDAAFSDYATDGLVVHLDGIRNAGIQAMHDGGAKAWVDLSRKGGAANFVNNGAATSGWKADGYYFNGKSYAIMNGTRTLDGNYTVQAVLDFDTFASCRDTYAQWPMLVGTTEKSDRLSIYQNQSNRKTPIVACKALSNNPGFALDGWAGDYMTMLFNGTQVALFPEELPTSWKTFTTSPGTRTLTFGGSNGDNSSGAWDYRYLTGTIKAIRIYDRALSNAELSANRAADEVRFFGRAPAATGTLVVTSDVEGLSGDQPCGAYRPAAGYAFTAPAEAVVDGALYTCTGYTLETWDGSAWGAAASYESSSYSAAVSSASKRLTWKWSIASRLTKVREDYDVSDYVQDGLYLHFDGIRNAGKTADHDNEATTWVNLGNGGTSLNATFDYALSGQPASSWAEDGYNFTYGGKFAKIGGTPNLWHTVTIQVVCDVGAGTAAYPHLFGATNDFCNIYDFTAGKRLFFKMFNKGSRPELSPSGSWEGKYANAIWLAGKGAVFQSSTPANNIWMDTQWRSDWTQFSGRPFYIGGVYFPDSPVDTDDHRLSGKVQALRVYRRSLTDEELEWNRKVDEARFKGIPPESNVIVVNDGGDCEPEAGAYKVDGSYTFTATTAQDDHGVATPVKGYRVETWNGSEWVRSASGTGDTYNYSDSTGKIRLTWNATQPAFLLSIR